MYSQSCYSGNFAANEDCFGECWLLGEDGIIAYLGHTKAGHIGLGSNPPMTATQLLDRYFFGYLTNIGTKGGGTNVCGNALVLAKTRLGCPWSMEQYELLSLNILADPSLPIWFSKPETLYVNHPMKIYAQQWWDITVKVKDKKEKPIPYAKVCLNKVNDIYEVGSTGLDREVTFHIYAKTTGHIKVTTTKAMFIPQCSYIKVYSPPEGGIQGKEISIDTEPTIYPNFFLKILS